MFNDKNRHAWFSQKQWNYFGGPIYLQGDKEVFVSIVYDDYETGQKKISERGDGEDFVYIGQVDKFLRSASVFDIFDDMDDLDYDYRYDRYYEEEIYAEEVDYQEDDWDEYDEMWLDDMEEESKNHYQNLNTENFPTPEEISKVREQGFSFGKDD